MFTVKQSLRADGSAPGILPAITAECYSASRRSISHLTVWLPPPGVGSPELKNVPAGLAGRSETDYRFPPGILADMRREYQETPLYKKHSRATTKNWGCLNISESGGLEVENSDRCRQDMYRRLLRESSIPERKLPAE